MSYFCVRGVQDEQFRLGCETVLLRPWLLCLLVNQALFQETLLEKKKQLSSPTYFIDYFIDSWPCKFKQINVMIEVNDWWSAIPLVVSIFLFFIYMYMHWAFCSHSVSLPWFGVNTTFGIFNLVYFSIYHETVNQCRVGPPRRHMVWVGGGGAHTPWLHHCLWFSSIQMNNHILSLYIMLIASILLLPSIILYMNSMKTCYSHFISQKN